jgi:hypothetical protein
MWHGPILGESRVGCPRPIRRFTRVICLDESALRGNAPGRRLKDAELAATFRGTCRITQVEFDCPTGKIQTRGDVANLETGNRA